MPVTALTALQYDSSDGDDADVCTSNVCELSYVILQSILPRFSPLSKCH